MVKRYSIAVNGRFLCQPVTGVQRYAHELLGAVDTILDQRDDIDVTVISPPLENPKPRWRNLVLRESGKLRGHAWEQLELPLLSTGKILFCPGNTAPIGSLLGRQRTVVCVHDLSYLYFPDAYRATFRLWYGFLMPIVLRCADALVTVSESERKSLVEHYPHSMPRLTAIQNGGATVIRENKSKAGCEPAGYILYVGSLSKRKNFPGMFEAACRLVRRRGYRFIFVGGIPSAIADGDVEAPDDVRLGITFAGQVNDTTVLASYYRGAVCFLFPSFYEASPLPPIEAMAYGAPVIASDIPSLRERCGDAALYCDPNSVDSIEKTVERLVDDTALQQKMRILGLRRAAEFTWDTCARKTIDVICSA
jgi:glycosyltransferase involved in cell wall biosynthesis